MESLAHDIRLPTRACGEYNLTIYGDLHEDAEACDQERLDEHMRRRAKLPGAMFLGIGDFGDHLLPSDLRRFMPSVRRADLRGYDDQLDHDLASKVKRFKSYPWIALGAGNHCFEVLKRHYTNPAERLAQMLGVPYAGYSGFLRLRFRGRGQDHGGPGAAGVISILYHHGAWGGRTSKGYLGARDWARMFEGWDICCFGHNHQSRVDPEVRIWQSDGCKIMERPRYYVACGTFLRTFSDPGKTPGYGEVKGYPPIFLGAPLIKITFGRGGAKLSVTVED